MSSAPHAAGHDAHDAHESHTFAGEPIAVLPPDEPRTPGWLPVLGVALFAGAAVVMLVGQSDATAIAAATAVTAEAAAPAPAPAPMPRPAATDSPRQITPEQRDMLRKRLQEAQQQGGAVPQPGQPAAAPQPVAPQPTAQPGAGKPVLPRAGAPRPALQKGLPPQKPPAKKK